MAAGRVAGRDDAMHSNTDQCSVCRSISTALLSALLDGGAGLWVLAVSGSVELSMGATFVGAIAPRLWGLRQNRVRHEGSK